MQRLRRVGREHVIKETIKRLNGCTDYKMHTKGEICRKMGIKATSRIRDILNQMADGGELVRATTFVDGFASEIAIYGLPVYVQLPLPEHPPIKINGVYFEAIGNQDEYDYNFECSMCGKPMPHRYCGMCTTCEQVYNG